MKTTQPKCPKWQIARTAGLKEFAHGTRAKIFISYKRDRDPDENIANQLFDALNHEHDVFIDKTMLVGTDWASCIETKLKESDFLISILSCQSVNSEMVKGEIEKAHYFNKDAGHPAILPVRLAYRDPFPYGLSMYLNSLHWANWDREDDTPRLIRELLLAVSGGELSGTGLPNGGGSGLSGGLPPPLPEASLELPEGTMRAESKLYVDRSTDKIGMNAIRIRGVTIPIKGPRQMGKSSLLLRLMDVAKKYGKQTVLLDFQLFDQAALASRDVFYRQFCSMLTLALGKEDKTEHYWDPNLGNNQRCSRYLEQYLLKELEGHLVLAMDEVERVFDTDFRSDFFSMLRFWHTARATDQSIWNKLDLVLVTSTEPYQLIDNLNQSPFNVGEVIELSDFQLSESQTANQLHGSPFSQTEMLKLQELVNGHPYLIRRALYLVATKRISVAELFDKATDERGPFGDHLRYHLFRMYKKKELVQAMCDILRGKNSMDEETFFRLRGAGLVRADDQTVTPPRSGFRWPWQKKRKRVSVIPRCQLYADYFREHLNA